MLGSPCHVSAAYEGLRQRGGLPGLAARRRGGSVDDLAALGELRLRFWCPNHRRY
jgi:hypothetical protein